MPLFFWRCVAVVGIIFFALMGFNPEPAPQYFHNFDKWLHGAAFLLLSLSFFLALPRCPPLIIVVLMSAFGLGIEFGQEWFLPKRQFDWYDFLMDALGALIAMVLFYAAKYGIAWFQKTPSHNSLTPTTIKKK